jgi:4-hydroxy-3-polyprenylbenzoate decarboxylase
MGTLSAIAHGASNNLIERAADVALKERRQLIVVPRETPYSQIHLENMLRLTQLGAIVLPASPGYYQSPRDIGDLVDFIVARLLDQLGIAQTLLPRWGENDAGE